MTRLTFDLYTEFVFSEFYAINRKTNKMKGTAATDIGIKWVDIPDCAVNNVFYSYSPSLPAPCSACNIIQANCQKILNLINNILNLSHQNHFIFMLFKKRVAAVYANQVSFKFDNENESGIVWWQFRVTSNLRYILHIKTTDISFWLCCCGVKHIRTTYAQCLNKNRHLATCQYLTQEYFKFYSITKDDFANYTTLPKGCADRLVFPLKTYPYESIPFLVQQNNMPIKNIFQTKRFSTIYICI